MGGTSQLGAMIANYFTALLLLAFVSLIVSILLYQRSRPWERALLTVATAFLISAIIFGFDYSNWDFRLWRAVYFVPSAIALFLILWRMFAEGWVEDELAEPEPEEERGEDGRPLWDVATSRNYLVCHWRGELSLPKAYWLNSVVLGFVTVFLLAKGVGLLDGAGASLQFIAAAMLSVIAVSLGLWLWGAVGTWRTCGRHAGRGGRARWANAAKVMTVIGVFAMAAQTHSLILQSRELGALAIGLDPIGHPAEFTIVDEGRSLLVSGNITSGSASQFRAMLEQAPPGVRTVTLASGGGRLLEARRMAATIKERRLDTRVEGPCMSACTLLLLAGEERSASPSAQIGFHQPSFPGFGPDGMEDATDELRAEYRRAGVEGEFVDRAMEFPGDMMWFPAHQQLLDANVLTAGEMVVRARTPESRARQRMAMEGWIARHAWRLNRDGPKRFNEVTTFERAEAAEGRLTYHIRIDADRRNVDIASARAGLRSAAQNSVCSDEGVSWALRHGAQIVFSYRDRSNRSLFDLPVTSCPEPEY